MCSFLLALMGSCVGAQREERGVRGGFAAALIFLPFLLRIAHSATDPASYLGTQNSVERRVNYLLQQQIGCVGKVHIEKINYGDFTSKDFLLSSSSRLGKDEVELPGTPQSSAGSPSVELHTVI